MASNLTDITNAINNLSTNFSGINSSNIVSNAIQESNNSSGGYIGLIVFFIFSFAIFIHIIKNKNDFRVFDEISILFVTLSICLDVGLYLLMWSILQSYQIYIFMFTCFIVLAFISLMKKDLLSPEV